MEAINFPNYGLLEAEGEITEIQFCDFRMRSGRETSTLDLK